MAFLFERKLNVSVKNAGVAGYGAAQSVRRAEMNQKNDYDVIVLGILVEKIIKRSVYIQWGFPKPVIKVDNSFFYSDVPEKKV